MIDPMTLRDAGALLLGFGFTLGGLYVFQARAEARRAREAREAEAILLADPMLELCRLTRHRPKDARDGLICVNGPRSRTPSDVADWMIEDSRHYEASR